MIAQRYPVFRVFLLFCAGILLANFVDVSFHFFAILTGVSLLLAIFLAFFPPVFYSFRWRWMFGLVVSIFFVSLGVFITHLYGETNFKNHISDLPEGKRYYEVELLEDPLEKARSYGMQVKLLSFSNENEKLVEGSLKMMLYLQKSREASALRYGDRIVINTSVNKLRGPQNPFEFDYRDFLNLKAIYAQAYADSTSYKLASTGHGWAILRFAKNVRRHFLKAVDGWNLPESQAAITKALLLGYRYDIDDNTLKAYASAGAMHVLAVSGLHVGIVYTLAGYLLFFLMRIKRGAIVKSIILILLLWMFALITGMSASVVRAATMFTFVAIGTSLKRYTSIYNTILGSAILLLIIRPSYLFEVGFQLSYAAVFGIVWIQPKLSTLFRPSTKVVKLFWDITTVSIAAQVATFPLGLYYFHQFPTLFLVSNLIVIPVVTVLMYLGLLLLVLSSMGVVWLTLIKFYSGWLWLMNTGVQWVEKQAAFLITEIHVSRLELVLLYVLIFSGFLWLTKGGYKRLVLSMLCIIFIGISQLYEKHNLQQAATMVVYSAKGHAAIGLYHPSQSLFIADSAFLHDDDVLTFHVKHHWWALDAKPQYYCLEEVCTKSNSWNNKGLFSFCGKLICIPNEGELVLPKADFYVINEGYPNWKIENLMLSKIILGNSLRYSQRKKWKEFCLKNKLAFHDLNSEGAFQIVLNP
ncbi:ComEC/Rec2-related protein [Owenweeksia hongkongensis DSM 17368]|uniref:ComEC/Rec2-related protein n=1 Tax=Owenweeksia hongkongensis (strain DSM 17368 / CIP 108786 / JCM 12287 / NRRL B-23963 / UST20020801) TaxID=926562 RepID=G8R4Y0_OWEHD|nr:ComEC/Rec2 family competence protein [Owenweeksia hongkongensis]AEV34294.1 ComEC/Rec2-related protein [Owenweeksia hongkongensis DSM 17368]